MEHKCKFPKRCYDYQPRLCEICEKHDKCSRCKKRTWKGECEDCNRSVCGLCATKYRIKDTPFYKYVCKNTECEMNYKNTKAYEKERYKGQTIRTTKIVGDEMIS